MLRFLLRRLAWSIVVLWFVVTATFVITYALPADPARAMIGPHGDAKAVQALRHRLGLDRPLYVQYGRYLWSVAHGDLGRSYRLDGEPVTSIIAAKVVPTAELAFATILLQLILGIPLGVVAAVKRDRPPDYAAQVAALIGQSAPTFFLGPLFMYVLSYSAGLFPISGYGEGGVDRLWHLFLPAFTLAVTGTAYYARLVRGEMIEVLNEDYVRTARAKGLSPRRVILRHALRNALVPVVTLVGLDLGVLMGGAIVTEYIFAWPGLGREAVIAILNLDLPIILGTVLLSAVAILVANLIVDVVYALLDPRVRVE